MYHRENLVNLAGGQYANIRKKVNKFKSRNQWHYEPITPEIVEILLDMQELWCKYRACSEDFTLDQENDGIIEILHNWDQLDLIGGAIIVNEIPVAYSIGEKVMGAIAGLKDE